MPMRLFLQLPIVIDDKAVTKMNLKSFYIEDEIFDLQVDQLTKTIQKILEESILKIVADKRFLVVSAVSLQSTHQVSLFISILL